jgi:hypothetical protein
VPIGLPSRVRCEDNSETSLTRFKEEASDASSSQSMNFFQNRYHFYVKKKKATKKKYKTKNIFSSF